MDVPPTPPPMITALACSTMRVPSVPDSGSVVTGYPAAWHAVAPAPCSGWSVRGAISGVTLRCGILLFDDVEVLDFAGPFEVFSTASRLVERSGSPPAFEVVTVAASSPVHARHGLVVVPRYLMGEEPEIHVLVVPGGVVTGALSDPRTISWIAARAAKAGLTTSVCTGAFLLAEAGLLDGRPATTHWEDLDDLAAAYPRVHVRPRVAWVDDGNIVTSAGISAGIEMSLHVVDRLLGGDWATRTARQMVYHPTGDAGVANGGREGQ